MPTLAPLDPDAPANRFCRHVNWDLVSAKQATCTEDGVIVRKCSTCGEKKSETTPALGHDLKWRGHWDPAPSCTVDGYHLNTCSRCDYTTRTIGEYAWGHAGYTKRQEPTCTSAGKVYLECDQCGQEIVKETLPALGHDYKQVGVKTPTCNEKGAYYLECTRCGDEKTETRSATGNHSYVLEGEQKPTCTKDGGRMYRCSVCDNVKGEVVAKTGHSWQQTYSEPATCAADGYKSYKCKNCSETKMETLPATGKCTWGNWITVTAASCSQDGLKVAECTMCGDTKKETIPSEGAHDYKTTSTQEATCDQNGSKSYTCSKCGKTKSETLKATGHNWKENKVIKQAACSDSGSAEFVCTKCGKTETRTIAKLGHGWDEWKVTKEATEKSNGTKERICKNCGKKETETIPKKGAASKPAAKMEAKEGSVEVFTTAGKVNLRSGPGKDNKRVTQVDKRNTNLGELLDAKADKKGVVWFQIKHKKKTGWITSDYAKAVVGETDGSARRIEGKETELTNLYLKSVDEAQDVLALEEDSRYDIYETEVSNEAVLLCGNDYVEVIELTGEGYTIYGVEVGDKIKDAQKKFKKVNLVLDYDSADEYVYHIICSQDSLFIDEHGFDGTLTVVVSDGKVESMRLEANSPAEE